MLCTMKRTFPRSKLKSIIKRYQKEAKLAKNVDILVFLDYMMFLRKLAIEANMKCQEMKEKKVCGEHIKAVLPDVLKTFRG